MRATNSSSVSGRRRVFCGIEARSLFNWHLYRCSSIYAVCFTLRGDAYGLTKKSSTTCLQDAHRLNGDSPQFPHRTSASSTKIAHSLHTVTTEWILSMASRVTSSLRLKTASVKLTKTMNPRVDWRKIAVARRQFVASFEDGAIEVIPIVPSGKTVEYIYYRTRRLLLVLCSVEETAASLWKTSAQRSSAQIT